MVPMESAHITLVTAEDCHFCHDGLETLHKLGREFRIDVEEVPLSSDRGMQLAERHRILFPPGLILDDAFVGFGRVSERRMRKLLSQRGTRLENVS
jgi:glutaredoxin